MALRIFAHDHNGTYGDYIFRRLKNVLRNIYNNGDIYNEGNLDQFKEIIKQSDPEDIHLAVAHAEEAVDCDDWCKIANNESVYVILISNAYRDYNACNNQPPVRVRYVYRTPHSGGDQMKAIKRFIDRLKQISQKERPELDFDLLKPSFAHPPDELLSGYLLLLAGQDISNELDAYFKENFGEAFRELANEAKIEILASKLGEIYK